MERVSKALSRLRVQRRNRKERRELLSIHQSSSAQSSSASRTDDVGGDNVYGVHIITDGKDTLVDIIAIHGLGGHWKKSWTHPISDVFWLEDLLPRTIPRARIISYGYNSTYLGNKEKQVSVETLRSHADTLVQRITSKRRDTKTAKRPIIFVAHSLGGIILKSALLISNESNVDHLPHRRDIIESTYGILFAGTPQQGADGASHVSIILGLLQNFSSNITNHLHMDLGPGSRWLQEQCEQYASISSKFLTKCFYETLKTNPSIGSSTVIVPKYSAILPGSVNVESIAINSDHRGMIKFESVFDEGYGVISSELNAMVQALGTEYDDPPDELNNEDKKFLQSLAYETMNDRRMQAKTAAQGTCEWIITHKSFMEWRYSDRGLLWLKGKPGSGKSTLMAYLYDTFLDTFEQQEKCITLDFFFHQRGTDELQKNRVGMLRSLLHQLYDRVSSIRGPIRESYKRKLATMGNLLKWGAESLEQMFTSAILSAAKLRKLVVLIDAIDEAGEKEALSIVSYFHKLNEQIKKQNCMIRILISCRHYPVTATIPSLEIKVEEENNPDIRKYVEQELMPLSPLFASSDTFSINKKLRNTKKSQKSFEEALNYIIDKSQHVFQWVVLVTTMAQRYHHKGDSWDKILQRLSKVPEDLHAYYERILEHVIDREDLPRSLHLMQWICLAKRQLTVEELRYALVCDGSSSRTTSWTLDDSTDFVDDDHQMAKLVNSLSGGLVELVSQALKSPWASSEISFPTPQFIHQSVQDFMLSGGLRLLTIMAAKFDNSPSQVEQLDDTLSQQAIIRQAHKRLCRSCLNYFRLDVVIDVKVRRVSPDPVNYIPWAEYATKNLIFHAKEYEMRGSPLSDITELFTNDLKTLQVYDYWSDHFYDSRDKNPTQPLLHRLGFEDLPKTLEHLFDHGVDTRVADDAGLFPIYYAARAGNPASVKVLASTGVDADIKSSFHIAIERGHLEVVKVLIESCTKLRLRSQLDVALLLACRRNEPAAVKMLLNAGANINARGGYYGSALHAACKRCDEGIAKLLLEAGANVNLYAGYSGTALIAVCANSGFKTTHLAIIDLLLEYGADVNAHNDDGSVLQIAIHNQFHSSHTLSIVRRLLQAGADVNAPAGIHGTALQIASQRRDGLDEPREIIQMLLAAGATEDTQNAGEIG